MSPFYDPEGQPPARRMTCEQCGRRSYLTPLEHRDPSGVGWLVVADDEHPMRTYVYCPACCAAVGDDWTSA